MQTIPNFSTKPNGDSYTVLWDDQVIGKVDFNLTTLKWEYSRYSQYPAIVAGPTPEACLAAAKQDHAEVHQSAEGEPTVTVIRVHPSTTQATYKAQGWGNWKQHGVGNSTDVTVKDAKGEFTISIPATFAAKLRPGNVVTHHIDQVTHQHYLRWSKKPVRRSAVAA